MSQPRNFLLFVPMILLLKALAFAQTPAQSPDQKTEAKPGGRSGEQRLSITKDVMNDFVHGALTSVRERFSADLKESVSENDLKDAHDQLTEVAGAFQSQISQTSRMVQGEPLYISRSQCSRYKVELRLMFDDANEIILFRLGPVSDMSPESMEAAARAVADELQHRQFADVSAKFNARMKDAMPTDRLEASWVHVMMHLGPFKTMRSARKDPDLDRVDVRCEFENGPMIVRVAFDPAGKVSGLWMIPAETEKDSQA